MFKYKDDNPFIHFYNTRQEFRSLTPKSLVQYKQEANSKHKAIVKAYQSGGYT